MAEINPFTVLGFAQRAFQGLSNKQIRSLVKSQYLAMAAIHHPDAGGKAKRFQEIQLAFAQLKEDADFDFWKKSFLRKHKDQLAELEKRNARVTVEVSAIRRALVEFWLAHCRCTKVVHGKAEIDGFSIFNPPPVSIIMLDRLKELLKKQADQERIKAGVKLTIYPSPGCFELQISASGTMVRQELVKTHFDHRKKWRPAVRQEWIELRDLPSSKNSYYWKPKGKPVPVPGVLIGSISTSALADIQVQQNSDIKGFISTEVQYEDYQILERGYSADEFEPYLHYVRPYARSQHLLVIAEGTEESNVRFKILGYARKILALKQESRNT